MGKSFVPNANVIAVIEVMAGHGRLEWKNLHVQRKRMKVYKGLNSGPGGQLIFVIIKENPDLSYLLPHIVKHSPSGFQWGYGGSGPADTALSILTDCVGLDLAKQYYQKFKWDFISIAGDELRITEEEILFWLNFHIQKQ